MTGSVSASLLESICGPGGVLPAGRLSFDGPHPALVAHPQTEEQAAAVLLLASQQGWAVVPRGGGTRDRLGAPLRQADLILSTVHLRRVVEYEPADLTVTVQAGMPMDELQQMLAAQGQRLPLDAPPGATVGGVVAAASSGPRRYRFGGPREMVLGMRAALTNGEVIACGARVVKNVAGYDLNKLFTGSMGTLGLITQVTFKVVPNPPVSRTLYFRAPLAAARAVVDSELEPESVDWCSETGLLSVGVAGEAEAVAYHAERLSQLLRTLPERVVSRAPRPATPGAVESMEDGTDGDASDPGEDGGRAGVGSEPQEPQGRSGAGTDSEPEARSGAETRSGGQFGGDSTDKGAGISWYGTTLGSTGAPPSGNASRPMGVAFGETISWQGSAAPSGDALLPPGAAPSGNAPRAASAPPSGNASRPEATAYRETISWQGGPAPSGGAPWTAGATPSGDAPTPPGAPLSGSAPWPEAAAYRETISWQGGAAPSGDTPRTPGAQPSGDAQWSPGAQPDATEATLQAILPPAAVEPFCTEVRRLSPGARVQASLSGTIQVALTCASALELAERIRGLAEAATGLGGHLTVVDAPASVKGAVSVWGAPGPGFPLMQALKQRFDPAGILNPGRFVGGL